jgi:hypothetical protein
MKRKIFGILLTIVLTLSMGLLPVTASTWDSSVEWTGQGSDSLRCDKLGESPERDADGWMHWIVTSASDVTAAQLVLGGSGSGTYNPTKYGSVIEFFTEYFDVGTLVATLNYNGTLPSNSQFVISDYCPGGDDPTLPQNALTVWKTVDTSYVRTHEWDIAKSITTHNEYFENDLPKVWLYINGDGDETATWKVDVTYEGYTDSDWNVLGEVHIENSEYWDVVITEVEDLLGGSTISVDFGVTFPYSLPAGGTLTGTYSEDGYFEGDNVVKVYYDAYYLETYEDPDLAGELQGSYDEGAVEAIVWGSPTTEVNETVNINDISDLFGEVALGTVTAPNDATFTYTKDFTWADYGKDNCGDYQYDNTATIVETEQSASATLLVNVQCYIYETAYAMGDDAVCFITEGFSQWGWTNPIEPGTYTWDLWAGAGQCDTSKAINVGTVTVVYGADGSLEVSIDIDDDYLLEETHVYAGTPMFPQVQQGKKTVSTVAPGQYYIETGLDGDSIYVIVHAVVGIPDPDFGPTS